MLLELPPVALVVKWDPDMLVFLLSIESSSKMGIILRDFLHLLIDLILFVISH